MNPFLDVCLRAAREGGAVLLEKLGKVQAREKGVADLVTEADLASQRLIREILLDAFPDHGFIGEEEGADAPTDHEYRWIADPLDGTTNFVHGVPHFCTSIALWRDDEPLVGVVFNPVTGECFSASAGDGALFNGRPMQSSGVEQLKDALACVGFPTVVREDTPELLVLLKAVGQTQAVRRTGSSALNMAYVAAGRFDVMWSFGTKAWDVAAGILLVREAGGVVTSVDGGPIDLFRPRVLVSANPTLHEKLVELVKSTDISF